MTTVDVSYVKSTCFRKEKLTGNNGVNVYTLI